MGTSASKYGNYVGLLSAVLFIVAAFMMILVKEGDSDKFQIASNAVYVIMAAGVVAIIAGLLLMLKEGKFIEKIAGLLIAVMGAVVYNGNLMPSCNNPPR